jgi:heterodisulfide reductase subunit B
MKVSYYPGCSLESTAKEYGESLEAVTNSLGIELEELNGWTCCGSSSAHVTDNRLAFELAMKNLLIANKAGKDVVVPCAACYLRLKSAEKELNSGKPSTMHIKHAADFIWEESREKNITTRVTRPLEKLNPVCYYGCLVTRPPEITGSKEPEDPTAMDNIMKSLGANVKKWSYKTDCCGGSLILTHPDNAKRLIKRLYDGALEAGADCIVVSCPMCHSNLDTHQKEIRLSDREGYNIPIYYFTELMGLAFGNKSSEKWVKKHLTDARSLLKQNALL